ncbi:SDR family NAD(P)-dependent oxidoreductase [Euzebya sp.]|uniref:SDR family NAD(P)-dependent oxidoreductase n=1 Tax=Euzebya sp. TaxID=1971409 RepID=UPI003517C4E4
MVDRLAGEVAIVTGAGSGLGRAAATAFAAEGAAVVCADLDAGGLAGTVAAITDAGGTAIDVVADLSDRDQADGVTRAALDAFEVVDIVYACAGIAGPGGPDTTPEEDFDRVIAVNLKAKWLSFRPAIPHMRARGRGSIIVQSSIGGIVGVPGIFPYAVAKGGCISMVKQAAIDLAPAGIRVNGIAPGTILTPLVEATYAAGGGMSAAQGMDRIHERYPLGRLGTPEEHAHLAVYVASRESAWTTGHIFVIDGGITVA